MPRFLQRALLLLTTIFAIHVPSVSASMQHFQQWYSEWGFIFDRIVHENCSSEYALFLRGSMSWAEWYRTVRWIGSGSRAASVVPLTDCILRHSSEYIKTGMAAANVILGLTPTILAYLGSGVDEISMLSVCGRRPLLALLLSAGSPSVTPLRLFEYKIWTEALDRRPGRLKLQFFNFYVEVLIWVIEHVAAVAAIANVVTLGYELGTRVVLVFYPQSTYLVLLWIILGIIPHLMSATALKLRIKIETSARDEAVCSLKSWIVPWETKGTVKFLVSQESLLCAGLSAVVSIFIALHIILGTLVFSSMLFISVRDCIPVLGRFLASLIICRIVLIYELARLRLLCHETNPKKYEIENVDEKDDAEEQILESGVVS